MYIKETIKHHHLVDALLNGKVGLEKEALRATSHGKLALTDHPAVLGDRRIHPYIQTDYGESQPEVITPPFTPYYLSYQWLLALSHVLISSLDEEEYLWPFSVPGRLPSDDKIELSKYTSLKEKNYRAKTALKYGKKRQLVSGVHINYSFSDELIEHLFQYQTQFKTFKSFKNELYLILSSNFLRYQWLLIYLFGATPVAEEHLFDSAFFENKNSPTHPMRSIRNSSYGFNNRPGIIVRYDKVEHYVNDIRQAVKLGLLLQEREFYGNIRLRGKRKETSSLLEEGIQYLEIRSFDNDPFCFTGLSEKALHFIHLFILTMFCLPEKASNNKILKGDQVAQHVANENPFDRTILYEEGEWLLDQMQLLIDDLSLPASYNDTVQFAKEWLRDPSQTISAQIMRSLEMGQSFLELGESLGHVHKEKIATKETLSGFSHLDAEMQDKLFLMLQKGEIVHPEQFTSGDNKLSV